MGTGFNLTEEFGAGGNKPFDWRTKTIGDAAEGEVLDTRTAQRRKFMGIGKPVGDPEFWNNNPEQPVMQLVITLQTSERDPADPQDTGARDVYLPAWGDTFRRVQKTMRAHGGIIEDGAHVRVPWLSGAGVSGDGRQFDFEYTPPVKGVNVNTVVPPTAPAESAPAAPVAPVQTTTTAPATAPEPAADRKTFTAAQIGQFVSMKLLTAEEVASKNSASFGQFDIVG